MKTFKRIVWLIAIAIASTYDSWAMHIMEGYLPARHALLWWIVSLPFMIGSFIHITRLIKRDPKLKIKLALSGAFVFLLSALKLPSVGGSSSHLTGTTLGTLVTGVMSMPLIGFIVLLFQALLLAHGGLTTLGANVFSMSIFAPFVAWGLFTLMSQLKVNRKINVFLTTFIASLSTYVVTATQLALAYPDAATGSIFTSWYKFLSIFAVTQVPLSIAEGVITVIVFNVLSQQGIEPVHAMVQSEKR